MKNGRRRGTCGKRKALARLLALLLLPLAAQASAAPFWAEFVSVGAGDCILIGCGDKVMMVDTAPARAWPQVLEAAKRQGVGALSLLAVTHPHPDHAGNVSRVVARWPVEQALVSGAASDARQRALLRTLAAARVPVRPVRRGESYRLGEADITIVWPDAAPMKLVNNQSIVMKVTYRGFSMLLTGDAESAAEAAMVAGAGDIPLASDLLKAGHHGLATSTTKPFAQAVAAKYAVISCDKPGRKVSTARQTLDTLIECGARQVFETGAVGDVLLEISAEGLLTISTMPAYEQ